MWHHLHYKCSHINCPEAYIGESGRALGERVKEHQKPPPQSFTAAQPLVIHQTLAISTSYTRTYIVIPGPSRKPCSYLLMNHLSIGTWINTNSHAYGTAFCRQHQCYSLSLPAFLPLHPSPLTPTHPFINSYSSSIPYPSSAYTDGGHVLLLVSIKCWYPKHP